MVVLLNNVKKNKTYLDKKRLLEIIQDSEDFDVTCKVYS